MANPLIDSGRFYRVAVNQVTSEQLQFDNPSSAWRNFILPTDVDASGDSTVLDALLIITEAGRNEYSDSATLVLSDPLSISSWPGRYFDVSRDGRVSPLDALQVLNFLALIGNGEGEAVALSGDMSDTVEWLSEDQEIASPMWLPGRQGKRLIPVQRIDRVPPFELQIQLQPQEANESSLQLVAQQRPVGTTSDSLAPEPELWAERVDQCLSEGLGFDEQL